MEFYLTVTCDSLPFLDITRKRPLFKEKGIYLSEINMFGKFLILKLTEERYKVSTRLITNSFPKIDKDLKTGF